MCLKTLTLRFRLVVGSTRSDLNFCLVRSKTLGNRNWFVTISHKLPETYQRMVKWSIFKLCSQVSQQTSSVNNLVSRTYILIESGREKKNLLFLSPISNGNRGVVLGEINKVTNIISVYLFRVIPNVLPGGGAALARQQQQRQARAGRQHLPIKF